MDLFICWIIVFETHSTTFHLQRNTRHKYGCSLYKWRDHISSWYHWNQFNAVPSITFEMHKKLFSIPYHYRCVSTCVHMLVCFLNAKVCCVLSQNSYLNIETKTNSIESQKLKESTIVENWNKRVNNAHTHTHKQFT